MGHTEFFGMQGVHHPNEGVMLVMFGVMIAIASEVLANASKIPDQHKKFTKLI